jgi:bifunctional enzyme CysN/CysC
VTGNVVRHHGEVSDNDRFEVTGGRGCTVLLTGLSGSGKSTLAYAVEKALVAAGRNAYVLDGDNLRFGLNADLGFSPEDRAENVRRVTEVARLMADAGLIALLPIIAPYEVDRAAARKRHDESGIRFVEVFVDTPLEVCEERDPKGLYARARAGEITGMTGIDAPYERPADPDLVVEGAVRSVSDGVEALVALVA